MSGLTKEVLRAHANDLVSFINKSPSPYHAVNECRRLLKESHFKELNEAEHWDIKPNDLCFIQRNQSTLIAFAVGGKFKPGNGFSIVGAHTDSPCLKIKPNSKRTKAGYLQCGVEAYGGGTWHTWFDRDLKMAGRVIIKTSSGLEHRLVHINKPIMRLPNLAIHLNREMGTEFKWNKESHLSPVIATEVAVELLKEDKSDSAKGRHHSILMKLLCEELKVDSEENILDFDIVLADYSPAVIGGAMEEFIFAPRLDNLISTFSAVEGLRLCDGLENDPNVRVITLFDNEEVGSQSAQGAASTLTELVLRRLSAGGSTTAFEEAMPKSLTLSCDVAHAVHPNYLEKHEDQHKPEFNKGMVIKINANQRYATTAVTSSILRVIADKENLPLQEFVIRQDMACGSTIGPITSAKLGMATIDVGQPLLSMHSIREMGDVSSVGYGIGLFKSFFKNFPSVYASLKM